MATLIESETVSREYDMTGTNAIVESSGKRFLICDGFGGIDHLEGGAVRWKHGMAIQLRPGDTFASLDAGEWNENVTLLEAVLRGLDDSRPVLQINPQNLAKSAGL